MTLSGTVTAQEGGEPIVGAMVTAQVGNDSKSGTTDADGFYQLDELNDGELTVTVSAGGFEPASGVAQASPGADITFLRASSRKAPPAANSPAASPARWWTPSPGAVSRAPGCWWKATAIRKKA